MATVNYAQDGSWQELETPSGARVRHAMDSAGRMLATTLNDQNVASFQYSAATGDLEEASFPTYTYRRIAEAGQLDRELIIPQTGVSRENQPMVVKYDKGLIKNLSGPHGLRYEFSYDGNRLTGIRTPRQKIAVTETDAARTVTVVDAADGRPLKTITVHRDKHGLASRIVEQVGSKEKEVQFANGRLSSLRDFDGNMTKYEWDDRAGLLSAIVDAQGTRVGYEYTQEGRERRLSRITFPQGRAIELAYDSRGRLSDIRE